MKYLAACCTAKNEESNILEWMAFHRAAGFEHLIVIDHGSTDDTGQVVSSFHDSASVTLARWDQPGSQMDIFNTVMAEHRDRVHWCAFIGADEFLYAADGGDLRQTLTEYESAAAVGVHWLMYGSSGHEQPQAGFVTETYIRRAETDFLANRHIRPIVRLASARGAITSHFFETDGPTVDENFQELPSRSPHGFFGDRPATHNRLRINHYHTRSRAEFAVKVRRGFFEAEISDAMREEREAMFAYHDRNEVEDRSAMRHGALMRFFAGDGQVR